MDCVICRNGTTAPGEVTVTLERGPSIVLIKHVPAQVCQNCGDYYLDEKTTALVLAQGEEAVSKGAELEVTSLRQAG